jgi:hypothetical protein
MSAGVAGKTCHRHNYLEDDNEYPIRPPWMLREQLAKALADRAGTSQVQFVSS